MVNSWHAWLHTFPKVIKQFRLAIFTAKGDYNFTYFSLSKPANSANLANPAAI